ncbi:uncharacterized protein B0P05DRAFT_590505 [Gilbertella persicaria]|uniref:uncharacterized protein n=1 Tax=Gilbertella persicaria TaxID=101096 RepID=UPI002220A10D|nr:uncharacterized protein B0P05DRAFT_590505 [Gilbertella persicaria]KAI8062323.1 hypothetical protein B0P05DRAFT_590505 [Gilbertella persicaria]
MNHVQSSLSLQQNAPRLPRSNTFRGSRLRLPQAIVYRDSEGNIVDPPSSISSAVSMTRSSYFSGSALDPDLYHTIIHGPPCIRDDKAVDLSSACNMSIEETPTNMNYVPLEFEIVYQDGGQLSANYNIQNVLRNDQSVYCSQPCSAVNILLRYRGWKESKHQHNRPCFLSHIIIQSPLREFTSPHQQGMVFVSHKPIDIEMTRPFDLFTQDNFTRYTQNNAHLTSADPVAWFTASSQNLSVIDMKERSAKYVLIKLLGSDNLDLQYIGFVGYMGSRCFAHAQLF